MSLIKCSECGKEISDKASACISCGNPIHPQSTEAKEDKKVVEVVKVIEIEQTAKKWKKMGVWASFIIFLGFFILFKSVVYGIILIIIGFIMVFWSNLGAWWTNG